ncbi:MAG: hypothetical protein ACYCTE_13915 [Acidimicrobiales bacterium]
MDWKKLTPLDRGLVAAALLFVIDLLVLPWVDLSIGPVSLTSSGTGSPDGFLGVLAILLALGIVADVALQRFSTMRLPSLTVGAGATRLMAAAAALCLVVVKLLLHLHPSYLGIGCWAALALGAVLVVAAHRSRGEATAPMASRD